MLAAVAQHSVARLNNGAFKKNGEMVIYKVNMCSKGNVNRFCTKQLFEDVITANDDR